MTALAARAALRVAALAVAAGCWRNPPPTAPEPPSAPQTSTLRPRPTTRSPCESAIDHALDVTRDELDPQVLANLPLARETLIEGCIASGWSDDVIRCLEELPTTDALLRCRDLMTQDQISDTMRRIGELPGP